MAKFRKLFTPFNIKNLALKNRVVMPPMCQYSATNGVPNDWHFVHYTSRAVGWCRLDYCGDDQCGAKRQNYTKLLRLMER